jgi:hypothetical protein
VEDEGDGGEKFFRDLLACSSVREAASSMAGRPRAAWQGGREQQQLANGHLHGRYGRGACLRLERSFSHYVLWFLNMGRIKYMGWPKIWMAYVIICCVSSDGRRMVQ